MPETTCSLAQQFVTEGVLSKPEVWKSTAMQRDNKLPENFKFWVRLQLHNGY